MSDEERQRERRFVFEKDQHQFRVARALLRTTLSQYVGMPPQELRFECNAYGKPSLAAGGPLPVRWEFNLSHTQGLIVLAVTQHREVGVDVESTQRAVGLEIANHYFAAAEVRQLKQTPPEMQQMMFFRFWTLKEAYIKARGMGLSLPLSEFSFKLDPRLAPQVSFTTKIEDEPTNWQFFESDASRDYRIALAVRCPPDTPIRLVSRETVPLAS